MANLAGLAGFVAELKAVRTNLVNELRHVDAALSVLGKFGGGSNYTKPKHTVSAASRRKMAQAQKARWARAKGQAAKPKRTISAAGKKRIAAAQRARWASGKRGRNNRRRRA
jgi:nucleoid-associated protein YgaU